MSEVLAKDIPEEQQFMKDYWIFRKQYYNPEDSDDYWSKVCSSADNLYNKYGEKEYFKKIILACLDDLDKRYKEKRLNSYRKDGLTA